MLNILVTYEVKDNTTDVNVVSLTDMFNYMGVSYKFMKTSMVRRGDIEWGDILLAIRPNSLYSYRIAKAAKRAGRYYILLIDDDIISMDKLHPDSWKRKYTVKCLGVGDTILTPNPFMQKDYSNRFNVKSIMVDAHVNEQDIKPMHSVGEKIKLVYPAGRDHAVVFNKYLTPVIKKLLTQYKDKIDITFVGVKPDVGEYDNVHYINNMSFADYLKYMQSEVFDIGLAPLEDTSFCQKKYFIKYIEYTKNGILGLYSNVYPYKYAVNNNENGILVNNAIVEWEKAITGVMDNVSEIGRMVSAAQSDLRRKYSIEAVTKTFISLCPEITSFIAPSTFVRYYSFTPSVVFYNMRNLLTKIVFRLIPNRFKYSSISKKKKNEA